MEEDTFWAYNRLVDWRTKSKMHRQGIKAGKTVFLLLLPTLEDRNAYRTQFNMLIHELSLRINHWESAARKELPCSDDGFSDLLAHIVGLGKEEYCAVLENPKLAFDRANKHDYEESFAYCIPYEEDYRNREKENE
jgi:hypothetical protein